MGELLRRILEEAEEQDVALLEKYITEDKLRLGRDSEAEPALTPEAREQEAQFQEDLGEAVLQERVDLGNDIHLDIRYFQGKSSKTLQDGTTIGFGDWVVELHMPHPVQEDEETLWAFIERIKRNFGDALRRVAHELAHGEHYAGATAVYGLSYFANSKMAKELGFETEDALSDNLKLARSAYGIILNQRFGRDMEQWEKYLAGRNTFRPPRWAYMSKKELIERYATQEDPQE